MTKFFTFIGLVLVTAVNTAAAQYLIVFRGLHDQIDLTAVYDYAESQQLTAKIFSAGQVSQAALFINSSVTEDYELYGFSQGAVSVAQLLSRLEKQGGPWPRHTITVGAYRTTNVNFSRYQISFDNYFDNSGRGNAGPGQHIPGVPHMSLQKHVNQIIIKR